MNKKKKLAKIERHYAHISEDVSRKVRASLEIINQVCSEQTEKRNPNLSIAEVGRLSEERGGPTERTIRNNTASGKKYQALIREYANLFKDRKSEPKLRTQDKNKEAMISEIEDIQLRYAMFELLYENRKLKNQLKANEEALKVPIICDLEGNQNVAIGTKTGLQQYEIKILSKFISETNLRGQNWSIDNTGRLIDKNGHAISERGFTDVINKLSSTLSNESNLINSITSY